MSENIGNEKETSILSVVGKTMGLDSESNWERRHNYV
jgi:hypothetical protein